MIGLEPIHYAAGAVSAIVSIIALEVGQYKIMLDAKTDAAKAKQQTKAIAKQQDEIVEKQDAIEKDIDGLAATMVRYTEADHFAVPDGGTQRGDPDDSGGEDGNPS